MKGLPKHRIGWATAEMAADEPHRLRGTRIRLGALIVAALLSAALSLIAPGVAMYAYLLTAAAPALAAWSERVPARAADPVESRSGPG